MTCWRDLPSLVVARAGDETVKAPLAPRFQEAIDEAAMRLGDTGSDDYLAGWERPRGPRPTARRPRCCDRVSADLDAEWPADRISGYLDGLGRLNRLAALSGPARPVLLDGGMGTLLQDSGLDDGGAGELWNVERPASRPRGATRRTPRPGRGC